MNVIYNCSFNDKKEYALALIKSIKLSKECNRGILLTDFNRTNLEKRLESIISKKFKNSVFVVIILCLLSSITYFKFDIFISKPVIYSLPKPSVLNDEYIYNTDIRVER